MTDFANFLFINELSKTEIAEYLGVQNSFITKLSKGEKKLRTHSGRAHGFNRGMKAT